MSHTSSYEAFRSVDKLVSKPVLGSDGAASWQSFRQETKESQRQSTAPSLQVKKADRLGTGFGSIEEERKHEERIRQEAGDAALGSGYTEFKQRNNAEEAAQRKQRKQIQERIRPKEKSYFIRAKTFEGWKFDYVFTTRQDWGTGYFWDGMDSLKQLNGTLKELPPSVGGNDANKSEKEHGVKRKEESQKENETKEKKKKKRKRPTAPEVVDDPKHPLNQVALAIQRRNEKLKTPPSLGNLPSGWGKASDPSSGKVYYFNRTTGERRWDPPPTTTPSSTTLPDGWKSARDPNTGKEYFFHTNGETSWTRPQG